MNHPIELILSRNQKEFGQIIPFDSDEDRIISLDLGGNNTALTPGVFSDTMAFGTYINSLLLQNKARYGMGGYLENREVYKRSQLFNSKKQTEDLFDSFNHQRTIHLGVDIWGEAGTPIYAPLGGTVHSFAYNNHFGDYGATIILQHQIDGFSFHTLYGHLALADLALGQNQYISRGEPFAHFGQPEENGNWPPHLHFQVIIDMELKEGDYPGVCTLAKLDYYRKNCPDPDLILNLGRLTLPD